VQGAGVFIQHHEARHLRRNANVRYLAAVTRHPNEIVNDGRSLLDWIINGTWSTLGAINLRLNRAIK